MRAAALIAAYALVVMLPLVVALIVQPKSDDDATTMLGLHFGLVAFAVIAMQFVLSARLKWVSRAFGLDMVYRFHVAMGIFAACLLVCHPVLLAAGARDAGLLFGPRAGALVWLGRGALVALLAQALVSVYRAGIGLGFQQWLKLHNGLALVILGIGFAHSRLIGPDLENRPMRLLWLVLLVAALGAYAFNRVARFLWNRSHRYTVTDVRPETPTVWTVRMAAPAGSAPYAYLPGQFHFLIFYRAPGLPVEEHNFTISSSPTEKGSIASSIKESGDFTRTMGQTRPGDTVAVQGPYGRFSYALHPDEKDLVFIAGGIGITPLRAMLRHMADTRADKDVLLIYANRDKADIAFRRELDEIAQGSSPRLKVVHVLSKPGGEWKGEKGRLDGQRLLNFIGPGATEKAYYICAPKALTDMAIEALKCAGVKGGRIHDERFWFV